jgi:uncharacterized protein (TIGR03437 family)
MHTRNLAFVVVLTTQYINSQTFTISTLAGGGLPVNIPGTSASLDVPLSALTADAAGNVFFAYHDTVLRWDVSTGVVTLVAGNGISGFGGDGGPATSAQLAKPLGLALDSAGNLYIADSLNYRIRKVSKGVITTAAGTGKQAFSAASGPALSTGFASPVGLAADAAGNLYIVDQLLGSVRKLSNGQLTTVAGTGRQGVSGDNGPATSAQLANPVAIAIDASSNLYIADYSSQSIRRVSNGVITTVAGDGIQGFGGDNGLATLAHLSNPSGVAVDSSGNLYIADVSNSSIRKVTNGVISTVVGDRTLGFGGDNGPAAAAKLNLPSQVAVDASGNLYIADAWNFRIRKVSSGTITSIVGNGTQGFSGDGGPATNAQFCEPTDLALDSAGNIYVSDVCNHHVRKISGGLISTVAGDGTRGYSADGSAAASARLSQPNGVAADANGNIYIADLGNNRVRKVSNGVITTVAGNGTSGFGGDDGPATSARLEPTGVTADAAGNLYVIGNYRVRRISNGIITTLAGNGTTGPGGDNGPAASAQFNLSYAVAGLAVDGEGSVYVPDYGNNRIRKISKGIITTVAGSGALGFSGDNGPATAARLYGPKGVAIDAAGNLYIADSGNNRIRKVSNGIITTIAGNGNSGFGGDNGPASNAQLSGPSAVAVDTSGFIYVADRINARIRVLTPSNDSCTYSVSPTSLLVPSAGGTLALSIQTAASCSWTLSGLPDWATAGTYSGTGTTSISITFASNTGSARTSDLTIGGAVVHVAQKSGAAVPSIVPGGVFNAASFALQSPLAAGSIATVYGDFLSTPFMTASGSTLPGTLGGVSVQLGGVTAPLFAVSSGQINFQVPWEVAAQASAPLIVTVNGQASAPETVQLAPVAPGIFTMNAKGLGQGAILDENYRLVDVNNPATPGKTVLQIYCTGLGAVSNQPASGSPPPSDRLSSTTVTPFVTVGGAPAQVLFSGLAPGSVGEYQVNVLAPAAASRGPAMPVIMFVGDGVSNLVNIAVE